MRVYEYPGFPNPARVRIALAEKGLTQQVEFITIDVPNGEHRTPAFLSKNPSGAVPVLELDDGTTIAECAAITEYIDHLNGTPTLTGTTPRERAIVHMMQRRAEAGLLEAVGTYFHHATPGFGPALETYQCAEWGRHQKGQATACMTYLDGILAGQPYLAGRSFSVADISAFAGLAFADYAQVSIPDACIHLREWRSRIAARPSVTG